VESIVQRPKHRAGVTGKDRSVGFVLFQAIAAGQNSCAEYLEMTGVQFRDCLPDSSQEAEACNHVALSSAWRL
jgi:hypothetical protein